MGLLVAGLVVTAYATLHIKVGVEEAAQREFAFTCDEIRLNVKARLAANAQILLSGAAFFDASQTVTRDQWKTFAQRQQIERELPGIQGIGFARVIPRGQLNQHILEIRREGFPNYGVTPAGDRDIYSAVVYIEPFTNRNQRAFGYDMFTEPTRRKAMARACDENAVALSAKVTLVQETGQGDQAGALMYAPVYRQGLPIETIQQRRTAIVGWVFSPYRMTNLMRGILRGWDGKLSGQELRLQVYDGNQLSAATMLYDGPGEAGQAFPATGVSRLSPLDFAGHRWTLRVTQLDALRAGASYGRHWPVLIGGIVISLLSSGLVFSMLGTTAKAQWMADRLTKELRESEESYRSQFVDSATVIMLIDAGDANIVDVNKAAVRFYGYSREQLLSMRMTDINSMPEPEILKALQSVSRPEGKRFEFQHRLADGSVRSVEASWSQIQFGGRTVVHSIIFDITERKNAEMELSRCREQYALVLSASNEGIWDWTIGTGTHFRSDRWKEMIGYGGEEFPGTSAAFEERIHPEDRDRVLDDFNRYLRGEIPNYNVEYRLRHKDGSYVWILARGEVVRDEHGNPSRVVGSHSDITERKRAEAGLREATDRLTLAARAGGVGVWDYDVVNNRLTWDDQMFRLYGITAGQFGGAYEAWQAGLHPGDRQRGDEEIQLALRGERDFDTEFRVKWPDGSIHNIRALALVQCDRSGHPLHMIGTNWDITKQKLAEEQTKRNMCDLKLARDAQERHGIELVRLVAELEVERDRAKAAVRAKSDFLACMSHEIRTPMNGVIGMTGLLLDTELSADQRRFTELVRASGESLMVIINDILDFSKIEAGRLELETLDFDLQNLLDDFATTIAVRAYQKGLELFCCADPAAPTLLRGDPGRLRQILNNLVGNAVKFTNRGEVAVRVAVEDEGEADCLLRFSVSDTGIGIPKGKIDMLFTRFSQVESSTSRTYGGTGLGLAISKQLATLMGGEVGVESQAGTGSTFWFTVRLRKQSSGAAVQSHPPGLLRGVRVLIVDDNATSREILATRMTFWGMRPIAAEDAPMAQQAVELALETGDPIQLALIDIRMPGIGGKTLVQSLKSDCRLAALRLVALTAPGAIEDSGRFGAMGFAAYVTKPVQQQELIGALSLAMNDGSGSEPAPRLIDNRHTAGTLVSTFAGRKARVLLAEDNITNQLVAMGILQKFGLSVDAVANGAEAVNALQTIPYDLVLMDVDMPVMDGLEATRQIRSLQSSVHNHDIPIIAMTAQAMQRDQEQCLKAGMNDYVSKPVSPRILNEALVRWLPEQDDTLGLPGTAEMQSPIPYSSEPAAFDREGLMERLMDDKVLALTVIRCFNDDIPGQLEALRRHLDAGESDGVARIAHLINGAASNVGGEAMRALACEMEIAGKAGNLGAVAVRMDDLVRKFDRFTEATARESWT